MNREDILTVLREELKKGSPIIGVNAGVGLTAKCAAKAGADLIFINNAGKFRTSGRSTLLAKFSFGNANDITSTMCGEILPVIGQTPAIVGVFAQDPFKDISLILENLQKIGVAGIQNSPTLGMMSPAMAKNLEAGMLGFSKEVKLIKDAHEMGFLTAPIAHKPEQAVQFVEAGADIIVATVGITIGKEDGAPIPSLEENISTIREIAVATKKARKEVLVLCHGGALSTPENVQKVFDSISEVDGFSGGSAIERIPVEKAIAKIIREFKEVGK